MAPALRSYSRSWRLRPVVAVAVALSLPLGMAACSKDSEESEAASTVASSSVASSTSSSTSGSSEPSSIPASGEPVPADITESAPQYGDVTPEPGNADITGVSTDSGLDPIEGTPASQEDSQAITNLVMGLNNVATARDLTLYIPRNACSSLVEANGGMDAIEEQAALAQDQPASEIPGYVENPPVRSVDDIRVSGDDASATVVSWDNTTSQETSTVMHFHRENGNWTFCG